MIRVPDRGLEIDEAIERTAGPNPVIHGFANRFPIVAVVAGAMIGRQCAADHCDAMRVSPLDHLVECEDEAGGGGGCGGVALQAADVIDALENKEIPGAALRDHVAVKARECVGPSPIEQDFIPADAFVQYREIAILWFSLQASRQLIRPSLVGVDGGASAIRDGVA